MKKEDMHVIRDMSDYIATVGLSRSGIAENMHKDISVVKKQLADRAGNMMLSTAYEYAEMIGGTICFLTDAEAARMQEESICYAEIDRLKQQIDQLNDQISNLTSAAEANSQTMQQQRDMLLDKEKIIMRKDETINKLLNKYVIE